MPAHQTLPAAGGKPAPANSTSSDRFADAFSRQMRSEIALLSIIALLIFGETVLQAADRALYQAKSEGPDKAVVAV